MPGRWVSVMLSGHTVEQVLSYDITEAEAAFGRPFDDEMDHKMRMAMCAVDLIWTSGMMFRVASTASYVLDGKCIRTAKIGHSNENQPDGASWVFTRPDGTTVEREPWSCVPGPPPILASRID